eukprot:96866-Chlamydomonas_euryale.AAC.1
MVRSVEWAGSWEYGEVWEWDGRSDGRTAKRGTGRRNRVVNSEKGERRGGRELGRVERGGEKGLGTHGLEHEHDSSCRRWWHFNVYQVVCSKGDVKARVMLQAHTPSHLHTQFHTDASHTCTAQAPRRPPPAAPRSRCPPAPRGCPHMCGVGACGSGVGKAPTRTSFCGIHVHLPHMCAPSTHVCNSNTIRNN